ncbi:hypothetical protein PENTCL1PPCAC_6541 [Pristionchus entomophagus]|uniref:Uncharacterized protein n=1 Tax=Pristionchus entomophagus TaxID=358040 RepID=A0AAV5SXW8_9BILA|nr:hypothetical protein PENTCL1PPCAC_6541 [Pristionchus entomophagus]
MSPFVCVSTRLRLLPSSFSSQTLSPPLLSLQFYLSFNMLGMMNSPSDSVEFYASNPGKSSQQLSAEDTKAFTEPKDKPQTTYTQDGRMVVDGKVVEGKEAATLWTGVLLRSAVQQMPLNEKKGKKISKEESNDESNEEIKEEITPSNEPLLSTAPQSKEETQEDISQ